MSEIAEKMARNYLMSAIRTFDVRPTPAEIERAVAKLTKTTDELLQLRVRSIFR